MKLSIKIKDNKKAICKNWLMGTKQLMDFFSLAFSYLRTTHCKKMYTKSSKFFLFFFKQNNQNRF